MTGQFPRLLVATEFPPNASGGGPAVVRQMLRGWPADKLSWWSCLPERDERFGQKIAELRVAAIPEKLYPQRRWCGQKSWFLETIWTPWAARHFGRTLNAIRPEAVWVIPHGWAIPPVARVLPDSGLGFHTTVQDYMNINSYAARFGAARSRRLAALADLLYARATTRDATSHPMIADLRARTGAGAAQMLHAGIEAEDLACLRALAPGGGDEPIRIAHAGTILVDDVFGLFVTALRQIRPRLRQPVTLELFGNHSYRDRAWFDGTWMNERGNLPAAQLTDELRRCHWGFSPMALTDDDPGYNRLSFPTKFISYLAAGLPVITLGHAESSVIKMARAYDVGICLSTADVRDIGEQLAAALAEPNPKARHQAGIENCARTEFDAGRMREVLREGFEACARVSRGIGTG